MCKESSTVDEGFSGKSHKEHCATKPPKSLSSTSRVINRWNVNRRWAFLDDLWRFNFNEYRVKNKGLPCLRNAPESQEIFHWNPWQNFHYEIVREYYSTTGCFVWQRNNHLHRHLLFPFSLFPHFFSISNFSNFFSLLCFKP